MRRSFFSEATAAGAVSILLFLVVSRQEGLESATPRAPAYRLCTHLDFFQLTPNIRIGNGPLARKRKLPSCVELDESFWGSVKRADVFPVRGSRSDRERDLLGLIVFLSTNIRGAPRGALLQVDAAPGGDYVLNIIRRTSVGDEGR